MLHARFRGHTDSAASTTFETDRTSGHSVAVALEEPEPSGNVKRRRLAYLFEPALPPAKPEEESTP